MTKKQINAAIKELGKKLEKGHLTLFEYDQQKEALEQQLQDLEIKPDNDSSDALEGFEYSSLY